MPFCVVGIILKIKSVFLNVIKFSFFFSVFFSIAHYLQKKQLNVRWFTMI